MERPLWTSIVAAMIAAPLTAGAFLVAHELLIVPIWSSSLQALWMTSVAAIAFGAAYHYTDARRSPLLFGLAMWSVIAPGVVMAVLVPVGVVPELAGGVLVIASGAFLGWRANRTRAAAISAAVAALGMTFISAPTAAFVQRPRGIRIYVALLVLVVAFALIMAALARILAARTYSLRA